MNITQEGEWMANMNAKNINKQEDVSLPKKEEELQDTTANGRRLKETKVNSTGNQTSNLA